MLKHLSKLFGRSRETLVLVLILLVVIQILSRTGSAPAATIVSESFNTNTADATTEPAYAQFSLATDNGGTAKVVGQQLVLNANTFGYTSFHVMASGLDQHFFVQGDMDSFRPDGNLNIGIRLDEIAFVFHHGYSGPGGFQIRANSPNAGTVYTSATMFTAVAGPVHMLIDGVPTGNPAEYRFNTTITQGLNTFTHTFINSNPFLFDPSIPVEVGFRRGGINQEGSFDNFSLVPEPSGAALVMAGAMVVLRMRRGRHG